MSSEPNLIDHEIRLRQIETKLAENDARDKASHELIKGHFNWIIGTVLTSGAGLILHAIKLV